jgi:hypothetical protein
VTPSWTARPVQGHDNDETELRSRRPFALVVPAGFELVFLP